MADRASSVEAVIVDSFGNDISLSNPLPVVMDGIRHSPVSAAQENAGNYWYVAKLASSTDAVIATEANLAGRKCIVTGVYFGNSYTVAKEVRLYFGTSGTNHGDIFYQSIAANSGGWGINLISQPVLGTADWGIYLDNSANASLYVAIAFRIVTS